TSFAYNGRALLRNTQWPSALNEEITYDGAGRVIETGLQYWVVIGDIGHSRYIFNSLRSYDADSNVIQTTNFERTDSTTPEGDLSQGTWLESDSRRTYTATWFD